MGRSRFAGPRRTGTTVEGGTMRTHADLLEVVRDQFKLPWNGTHGGAHWARVRDNGLRLARITGADPKVVELFAFLHDACRLHDGSDPGHGRRAAEFAESLHGAVYRLSPRQLEQLRMACEGHSDGLLEADVTVQTCWDADRLDLGRIGIRPEPSRLCTEAARQPDILEWAYDRSLRWRDA
jgi:uncharacterized protein